MGNTPNENVLELFSEEFLADGAPTDPQFPAFVNAVSCGLHVVHDAFKFGVSVTGWKLDSLLKLCGTCFQILQQSAIIL